MVVLSTAATVIASQSLITGVFSLTHQATQLGVAPASREVHTSEREIGQIYVPIVNVLLAIVCIGLVLAFQTSAALGGAYGLAVSLTMLATTIAYANLTRTRFKWPLLYRVPVIGLFLVWDVPFVLGNLSKIREGAWLPLLIAVVLFILSVTWDRGRNRLMSFTYANSIPVEEFIEADSRRTAHGGSCAVFFTADPDTIPAAMQNWWIRENIASSAIILVNFVNASRPYVRERDRTQIDQLSPNLLRARAYYGFMEDPSIEEVMASIETRRPDMNVADVFYYLLAPSIEADTSRAALPAWQRALYIWMTRISRPKTDSLGIPMDRVLQFGVSVPV
jgi:KUP system potassium uptake protein